MNYLYSFRAECEPNSQENVCKNNDYCHMIIPEEDNNTLKYNQNKKSLKALFVIYVATELLLEKLRSCDNSLEESSTTKTSKTYSLWLFIFLRCSIAVRATANFTAVLTS